MDKRVEQIVGTLFRLADRLLPTGPLACATAPLAAWAGPRMALRRVSSRLIEQLPTSLRRRWPRRWWRRWCRVWCGQMGVYTTRFLSFIPERLRRPRWQRRCRLVGLSGLEAALAGGPVILLTLHYGDLTMLYHWLRARGIAAAFVAGRKQKPTPAFRQRLDLLADRANGLEGLPRLIPPDSLWDAREFLEQRGHLLVLPVDRENRRDLTVDAGGLCLSLATGGLRLAGIVGASVLPCLINSHRWLGSTIRFGPLVPMGDIANRARHEAVLRDIARRLLRWASLRPEQCSEGLISNVLRASSAAPDA